MSNQKEIQAGIRINAKGDASELKPLSEEIKTAAKNINNLNFAADNLGEAFKNSSQDEVVSMLQDIETHAAAASSEIENLKNKWLNIEKLSEQAGLSMAVAAATQFEHNFAKMGHSVTGTSEQMALLKQQIKDLSNEMGVAAADIMQVAGAAAGFGVATEDLAKFSEVAMQMSKVFGIAGEEVAQSLANIQKAFQFENTEQLQLFADNLAKLGEVANASEDEMLSVVETVSTAANQFGLSATETTALSSAFLALGRSPAEASKSIKTLLQKLATAETQSAGFQAALESIGLSANQLATDIREKPQAALNEFLQTIKGLDETTQANVLQDLFGDNVGTQIQAVVQNLGEYQNALSAVAKEQDAVGTLAEKYGKGMETLIGELAKLKNTVQNTLATLGDTLTPFITTGVKGLNQLAEGVAWVTKTFPNLTKLAVLFGTARMAINTVEIATKKWSLNTIKSLKDIGLTAAKEMGIVSGRLKTAAVSAKELSSNLKEVNATGLATAKADVADFVDNIGNIGTAFRKAAGIAAAAFAAWDIGSSIGKSLYENSDVAAAFGDWLGKGIAYIDAALTDRTIEDVKKHYKTKAEMTAELAAAEQQAAQRQAELEKQRSEQLAQQKQHIADLKQEYNDITERIDAQIASLGLLNAENTGSGALYEQITAQIGQLTEKQAALNAEIEQHGEKIAKLAGGSEQVKTALSNLGLSLNQLQTGISDSAAAVIADFSTAAEAVGHSADNMQALFSAAVAKMGNATEIDALKAKLQEVGEQGTLTAEEIEKIADTAPKTADKVSEAFKKIGVDIDAVNKGISSGANRAMTDFQAATNAMAAVGEKDAKVIQAAFDEVFKRLKTGEELTQFQAALKASGDIALLSSEQVARLNTAIAKTADSTQDLSHHTEKFGKDAQKSYSNAADAVQKYKHAQDAAADSGIKVSEVYQKGAATAGSLSSGLHAMINNAIKASGASDEAAAKIKKMVAAMTPVGGGRDLTFWVQDYFKNLNTVLTAHQRATNGAISATERLNKAVADGTVNTQMLATAATAGASRFNTLDKATLDNLRAAIDQAKKKLEEMQNAARQTRAELEKEYAQTMGDTDTVANMEQKAKIRELQEKLQQAQKSGDSVQISEYQRALKLQKQIGEEKQRQAEAEKVQAEIAEQEKKRQEKATETPTDTEQPISGSLKEIDIDLPQKVEISNSKGLAEDLARQIGETLTAREKQIVEKALNAFSNEIKQALKRQSR